MRAITFLRQSELDHERPTSELGDAGCERVTHREASRSGAARWRRYAATGTRFSASSSASASRGVREDLMKLDCQAEEDTDHTERRADALVAEHEAEATRRKQCPADHKQRHGPRTRNDVEDEGER